jgi:hypothetical protein
MSKLKVFCVNLDGMSAMLAALYDALYNTRSPFHWVYFTRHETIRGRVSKDFY